MKSPRDLLLEQHRDQSSALDEIRRQVIAEQRKTGLQPVTERIAANNLARQSDATVAVEGVTPTANNRVRELTVGTRLATAGNGLQTCHTWLAAFRSWLTFNRAAWGSFAAAWVVIIGLNISTNMQTESDAPVRSRADAREVLEGVREYQIRLASLLFDQESVEEQNRIAEPKNPGPRSEAIRPRRNAQIQSTTFYA